MEKLKQMKEALIGCVESQVYSNLKDVDAKELGEAMDMIKDLSEAIYYCTITEAMEGEEHGKKSGKGQHGMMYYTERVPMDRYSAPIEYYDPRYRESYPMYDDGRQTVGPAHAQAMRGYKEGMIITPYDEHGPHDGHSWKRRKMYMEGKHSHRDKTKQMQELDSYMQELTSDITEMISDASPEEKQLLQQKLNILATKIK